MGAPAKVLLVASLMLLSWRVVEGNHKNGLHMIGSLNHSRGWIQVKLCCAEKSCRDLSMRLLAGGGMTYGHGKPMRRGTCYKNHNV